MGLHDFDCVLAVGELLRRVYVECFGLKRVWMLHEAAVLTVCDPQRAAKKIDVVWVGN